MVGGISRRGTIGREGMSDRVEIGLRESGREGTSDRVEISLRESGRPGAEEVEA